MLSVCCDWVRSQGFGARSPAAVVRPGGSRRQHPQQHQQLQRRTRGGLDGRWTGVFIFQVLHVFRHVCDIVFFRVYRAGVVRGENYTLRYTAARGFSRVFSRRFASGWFALCLGEVLSLCPYVRKHRSFSAQRRFLSRATYFMGALMPNWSCCCVFVTRVTVLP